MLWTEYVQESDYLKPYRYSYGVRMVGRSTIFREAAAHTYITDYAPAPSLPGSLQEGREVAMAEHLNGFRFVFCA